MPWVVVKFIKSNEIETVPEKWYDRERRICLYPPYQRTALERAIKQRIDLPTNPADEGWMEYEAELMSKNIYNSFTLANAKASKACLTSDISETEDLLPSKRIPKKKVLDDSSSDNSDNSDSEFPSKSLSLSNIPKPPRFPTSENIRSSQIQPSGELTEKSVHSEIIKCVIHNKKLLENIEKRIINLTNELEEIKLSLVKQSSSESSSVDISLYSQFPLKSLDEVEDIRETLLDTKTFETMVKRLANLGGNTYKECVRRFMSQLITDDVALLYTLHGHREGKKAFVDSGLCPLIIEAVKICDSKITIKEIELQMGLWLTKTGERKKKGKSAV